VMTIDGAEFQFKPYGLVDIGNDYGYVGEINAIGALFTAYDNNGATTPSPGAWGGVDFNTGASDVDGDGYVGDWTSNAIEYAQRGLELQVADVKTSDNHLLYFSQYGVYCDGGCTTYTPDPRSPNNTFSTTPETN
jgi:hypothetical protein